MILRLIELAAGLAERALERRDLKQHNARLRAELEVARAKAWRLELELEAQRAVDIERAKNTRH